MLIILITICITKISVLGLGYNNNLFGKLKNNCDTNVIFTCSTHKTKCVPIITPIKEKKKEIEKKMMEINKFERKKRKAMYT